MTYNNTEEEFLNLRFLDTWDNGKNKKNGFLSYQRSFLWGDKQEEWLDNVCHSGGDTAVELEFAFVTKKKKKGFDIPSPSFGVSFTKL